jgi:hypothetical protein
MRLLRALLRALLLGQDGNALPIMALITSLLLAFIGCAIDGGRLYMVNARLQQACDAGVLAGRKAMVDTTASSTTLDATATAAANAYFANNIRVGWYGITAISFTPSKSSDAQVLGAAHATVPMSLMRIFGFPTITLNARCEGKYQVSDVDVMFVLDTTGSMACLPTDDSATCSAYVSAHPATAYTRPADGSGSGNLSVAGYPGTTAYAVPEASGSRISALRSAVLSFYDTMTAAADPTTHVRYGFVTYTSTINAGRAVMDIDSGYVVGGASSTNNSWTYQTRYQSGWNNGQPVWQYQASSVNVNSFAHGNTVDDPSKTTAATSQWTGCLEERSTTAGATSFSQSALPNDLNPDLAPNNDINTQWKPMWPELIYARWNLNSTANASSTGDSANHTNLGTATYYKAGYISCGKPVARLQTMTRAQISAYVNAADFKPMGGTYHDVGMIWGTRLLSPTGLFAADTAAWSGHEAPRRVIVFLTDGDMAPSTAIYGMYGIEYYDKRVSGGNYGSLKDYHNARFLAACSAAKARNISVWTVALGMGTTSQLQSCATTPAQALSSTSGAGLATQFSTIASQMAKLRIAQ